MQPRTELGNQTIFSFLVKTSESGEKEEGLT